MVASIVRSTMPASWDRSRVSWTRLSIPRLQPVDDLQDLLPPLLEEAEEDQDEDASGYAASPPEPALVEVHRGVPDDREDRQADRPHTQEEEPAHAEPDAGKD